MNTISIKSELTGETYSGKSFEEVSKLCADGERAFKEEVAKKAESEKQKNVEVSKERKELSEAIEEAENRLDIVRAKYEDASKQADALLTEASEQAEKDLKEAEEAYNRVHKDVNKRLADARIKAKELLAPAKKEVEEAERAKFNALLKFSERFGSYNVRYTGDRAAKEYNRMQKQLERAFDGLFNNFNWLF